VDRIHLLIALLSLPLLACAVHQTGGPEADGDRAFSYLRDQCTMGPRYPGSPGHDQLILYLQTFLTERADSVRLDRFSLTDTTGVEHDLTNIIAMFKPDHRSRVLFCCHFDTRPISDEARIESDRVVPVPGANDGASGVAVLMEIAGLLADREPPVGVDLVFFDGEDNPSEMLLGSKMFAETHRDYKPLFGILVDMVGDSDLQIKKEQYSEMVAPEIVNRVWRKAAALGYGKVFQTETGYAIIDDHIPLLRSGIRCIDIIDFDYPYWHTPEDTPDKCSPESLRIISEVLLSLLFDLR